MKKIIIIAGILILGLGSFVRADTASNQNSFYYIFHLYYDNGQLKADRDFQFKYDVIPGDYIADPVTTQFPYRGEIVDINGQVVNNFTFDPKQGNSQFTVGKISVKAPYIADAQKVIFYDNQNQPVLTMPVSDSSFCNDDGICNADRGEDYKNCPKDCKQPLVTPLPTTTPTATTTNLSGLWSGILYTLVGLIFAGLVWWFFKRRHDQGTLPPLPPPSSPLPTPPTPPTPNNPV